MEKVGQDHSVHIVFDKVVEIIINGNVVAKFLRSCFSAVFVKITNRYDVTAEQLEIFSEMSSAAGAEYAHFDLIHVVPPCNVGMFWGYLLTLSVAKPIW